MDRVGMIAWLLRSVVTYEHGASELEALFDLATRVVSSYSVTNSIFLGRVSGRTRAQNEWSGFVKAAMAQNILECSLGFDLRCDHKAFTAISPTKGMIP